jgi:hypothetical protein
MMELPDFTTVYEKLGVAGTMLLMVVWLLWHNIRSEWGKAMTPDSLSKRLAGIEEEIGKLAGRAATTERSMERLLDRARDYDTWKERLIVMWDRHQEKTYRRHDDQRRDMSRS